MSRSPANALCSPQLARPLGVLALELVSDPLQCAIDHCGVVVGEFDETRLDGEATKFDQMPCALAALDLPNAKNDATEQAHSSSGSASSKDADSPISHALRAALRPPLRIAQNLTTGFLNTLVTAIIEFWRNSAVIVLLLVFNCALPVFGVTLSAMTVAAMMLGLNTGGYATRPSAPASRRSTAAGRRQVRLSASHGPESSS